jgi:uncharacterized protein (TIGR02996 family)
MKQERAFVEAIRLRPDDDAPRLAYAAWLKERGDPRGDFIETQVHWHQAHEALDGHAMVRLATRDRALQRQHQAAWLGPLEALGLYNALFRRGFVEGAGITTANLLRNGEKLFELAPLLHELGFYGEKADLLPSLADNPLLRRLDSVSIYKCSVPATALSDFAASPNAANLRSLELRESRFAGAVAAACVQVLELPRLTCLRFTGNGICPRGLTQRLAPKPIGDEIVAVLAQAPNLSRLRVLSVGHSKAVTDAAVAALVRSPYLACSEGLHMYLTAITDATARALADSPRSACLTRLDMLQTAAGNAGLEALIQSSYLGALRDLAISEGITDPGVRMLAAAPFSSRLRRLDLSYNRRLGVPGAEALAASEHLTQLQELRLRETRIGPRGTLVLLHSTRLPALRGLDIFTEYGKWDPAVAEAVEQRFGV